MGPGQVVGDGYVFEWDVPIDRYQGYDLFKVGDEPLDRLLFEQLRTVLEQEGEAACRLITVEAQIDQGLAV